MRALFAVQIEGGEGVSDTKRLCCQCVVQSVQRKTS